MRCECGTKGARRGLADIADREREHGEKERDEKHVAARMRIGNAKMKSCTEDEEVHGSSKERKAARDASFINRARARDARRVVGRHRDHRVRPRGHGPRKEIK